MPEQNPIDLQLSEILEGFSDSSSLPGYLRISVIDACNHSCFFCHNEGSDPKYRSIDENLMFRAIKSSFELKKKKIKFTGGEPTLHPKITQYLIGTKQLDPESHVSLITNGTMLSQMPMEFYSSLDKLTVSLHSLDRNIHSAITGKDTLPQILRGIEYAKSMGLEDIQINSVLCRHNMGDIASLAEYARDNGFSMRFLDILPCPSEPNNLLVSNPQITAAIGILRESRPDLHAYLNVKAKPLYQKCGPCDKKPFCGESEYLRLSVSGDINPCLHRPDLKISLSPQDSDSDMLKKMALGFRRIYYDNI